MNMIRFICIYFNRKPSKTKEDVPCKTMGTVLFVLHKLNNKMERAKGIEPSYPAWEAGVLPLNYARKPLLFITY